MSPTSAASIDEDRVWAALRQGARNVAGVRYQLRLTAWLIVLSRAGRLPFDRFTPEGLEDVDCQTAGGERWLIQAKELGAGAGRFRVGGLAEVIKHAADAGRPSDRIVAVTDGQLESRLAETGWKAPLSQVPDNDLAAIRTAVGKAGLSHDAVDDVLARTHLVPLPWNLQIEASEELANSFGLAPAVASLALARLIDDVSEIAANQRSMTRAHAGVLQLSDLDVLVEEVVAVVDRDALAAARLAGVCRSAPFATESADTRSQFLQGVDAGPSHIGANYDVLRPIASLDVQSALQESRYALIAGPSGAGKSTQLWRSARDYSPNARVLRVERLATERDVALLRHHVTLLQPSARSPVVVVCDDLGRPHMAMWSRVAHPLLEVPHVYLLAAARHEDLTPDLLHGGRLVVLSLDAHTAEAIGMQLIAEPSISLQLELREALAQADGQLMEFIALLTTGHRLRRVLLPQADRLDDESPEAADLARMICAAHTLGVSVAADRLPTATGVPRGAIRRALRRLQDEHIVTSADGQAWRGLHQLRSDVLTEYLHRTPPPPLAETLSQVLSALDGSTLGWAMRRVVEMYPRNDSVHEILARAARLAADRCASACDLAELLEGIARVDDARTANDWAPIIRRNLRPGASFDHLTFLTVSQKVSGVQLGGAGGTALDRMGRHIASISRSLNDPSTAFTDAVVVHARSVLSECITAAALEDALRLLEALVSHVHWTKDELLQIAARFPWLDGVLSRRERHRHARLLAALHACCDEDDFEAAFGDVSNRASRAAQSHPDVVAIKIEAGARTAVVTLLHPTDESPLEDVSEDWDSGELTGGDLANDRAVTLAKLIGWASPELDVVEVHTIGIDGTAYGLGDLRPGHKRLDRKNRPEPWRSRRNIGVRTALARVHAASSWTELVRRRAVATRQLLELVGAAPRRLQLRDHSGRRVRWAASLKSLERELGLVPADTLERTAPSKRPTRWDRAGLRTPITSSLRSIVQALQRLIGERKGATLIQVAAAVGSATTALTEDIATGVLMSGAEEHDLARLVPALTRLRGLLVAVHRKPSLASAIKGRPEHLAQCVEQIVEQAALDQLAEERAQLDFLADIDGAELISVADESPFPSSIRGHQWIAILPLAILENLEAILAQADAQPLPVVPVIGIFKTDDGCVPIAFGVKSGRFGRLAASQDEIEALAIAIDQRVLAAPNINSSRAIIQFAMELMWSSARDTMRPASWSLPNDGRAANIAAELAEAIVEQTSFVEELVAEAQALLAIVSEPWSQATWERFQGVSARMTELATVRDLASWGFGQSL